MTDTLKSICEQCTHLHNPQLDFIPQEAERQRQILLQDLKELVSAGALEQEKTVIVLAGALFESLLYCLLQAQEGYIASRRGSFTFDPEQNLDNYVNIFNRWFSELLTIPDIVVEYRNMVHMNRELKFPPDIRERAARDMVRFLDALLGKLAESF
jgi:hypothetical protein